MQHTSFLLYKYKYIRDCSRRCLGRCSPLNLPTGGEAWRAAIGRLQGTLTPLHRLPTIYMAAGLAKGEMKQWGLRLGVLGNKPTRGGGSDQIGLTHPLTGGWATPISTSHIIIFIIIITIRDLPFPSVKHHCSHYITTSVTHQVYKSHKFHSSLKYQN